MKRLTTNKLTKNMNMYELAHNSSYIDKYGNAKYRDYETDIDARTLTRELLKKYAGYNNTFEDDNEFDNAMTELLQYGTDTIDGFIALFYRNLWAMAELRETLKWYEESPKNIINTTQIQTDLKQDSHISGKIRDIEECENILEKFSIKEKERYFKDVFSYSKNMLEEYKTLLLKNANTEKNKKYPRKRVE